MGDKAEKKNMSWKAPENHVSKFKILAENKKITPINCLVHVHIGQ